MSYLVYFYHLLLIVDLQAQRNHNFWLFFIAVPTVNIKNDIKKGTCTFDLTDITIHVIINNFYFYFTLFFERLKMTSFFVIFKFDFCSIVRIVKYIVKQSEWWNCVHTFNVSQVTRFCVVYFFIFLCCWIINLKIVV